MQQHQQYQEDPVVDGVPLPPELPGRITSAGTTPANMGNLRKMRKQCSKLTGVSGFISGKPMPSVVTPTALSRRDSEQRQKAVLKKRDALENAIKRVHSGSDLNGYLSLSESARSRSSEFDKRSESSFGGGAGWHGENAPSKRPTFDAAPDVDDLGDEADYYPLKSLAVLEPWEQDGGLPDHPDDEALTFGAEEEKDAEIPRPYEPVWGDDDGDAAAAVPEEDHLEDHVEEVVHLEDAGVPDAMAHDEDAAVPAPEPLKTLDSPTSVLRILDVVSAGAVKNDPLLRELCGC